MKRIVIWLVLAHAAAAATLAAAHPASSDAANTDRLPPTESCPREG